MHQLQSLDQDQCTVAQRTEMTVDERSMTTYMGSATTAARAAVHSSMCIWCFNVDLLRYNRGFSITFAIASGETFPDLLYFLPSRDLLRAQPGAHGSDMRFVLIRWPRQSVRSSLQTGKQRTGGTKASDKKKI